MDQIEITLQKENKLLKRNEIEFAYSYETKPPKRDDVKQAFADKMKLDKENVIITKMINMFGHRVLKTIAHIYHSKEDAKRYENKTFLRRNKLIEAKKAGAA